MTSLVPRPESAIADSALSEDARRLIAEAMSPNTRRAYGRIWDGRSSPDGPLPEQMEARGFVGWCVTSGRSPMPATPETLAEYVAHLCTEGKAPATIEQVISAIHTVHRKFGHGREYPSAEQAREVLRGYRRNLADCAQRQAVPLALDGLRAIVERIDRSGPLGLRDHALILLGIVSFGRRSEIASFEWGDLSKAPEGLLLRVRRSKTDQEGRGEMVPILQGAFPRTDPPRVLGYWRDLCEKRGITSGPILRSVDRHGNLGDRMSPQAVDAVVRKRAEQAGLGPGYSAHSLRAGAATIAYRNGAPVSAICRLGRWKQGSPVVLGYIRQVDQWKEHPFRGVL